MSRVCTIRQVIFKIVKTHPFQVELRETHMLKTCNEHVATIKTNKDNTELFVQQNKYYTEIFQQ